MSQFWRKMQKDRAELDPLDDGCAIVAGLSYGATGMSFGLTNLGCVVAGTIVEFLGGPHHVRFLCYEFEGSLVYAGVSRCPFLRKVPPYVEKDQCSVVARRC